MEAVSTLPCIVKLKSKITPITAIVWIIITRNWQVTCPRRTSTPVTPENFENWDSYTMTWSKWQTIWATYTSKQNRNHRTWGSSHHYTISSYLTGFGAFFSSTIENLKIYNFFPATVDIFFLAPSINLFSYGPASKLLTMGEKRKGKPKKNLKYLFLLFSRQLTQIHGKIILKKICAITWY